MIVASERVPLLKKAGADVALSMPKVSHDMVAMFLEDLVDAEQMKALKQDGLLRISHSVGDQQFSAELRARAGGHPAGVLSAAARAAGPAPARRGSGAPPPSGRDGDRAAAGAAGRGTRAGCRRSARAGCPEGQVRGAPVLSRDTRRARPVLADRCSGPVTAASAEAGALPAGVGERGRPDRAGAAGPPRRGVGRAAVERAAGAAAARGLAAGDGADLRRGADHGAGGAWRWTRGAPAGARAQRERRPGARPVPGARYAAAAVSPEPVSPAARAGGGGAAGAIGVPDAVAAGPAGRLQAAGPVPVGAGADDRADGVGQVDDAGGADRARQPRRRQARDHARGPGRAAVRQQALAHPPARGRDATSTASPRGCGRRCARTPTSSWSARCATRRRSRRR
jgi:hypothetical protein